MSLSNLFTSNAFAQDTTAAAPNGGFMSLVPLLIVFVIIYLLMIRPQQKKAKQHQEMINNLKIGNKVCTSGGVFGTVKNIDDKNNTLELEIAKDTVIKILKYSVTELVIAETKDQKVKKVTKAKK